MWVSSTERFRAGVMRLVTPTNDITIRFEQERPRLRAVAAGILGSVHEADDVVQEAWLRLDRTDPDEIVNLPGWLTVVVSRIALDHVRARAVRREVAIDTPETALLSSGTSVETGVIREEAVTEALSHAVDSLSPLESATFILHDLFGLPFDEIAAIIERSPQATRKLASRARQKVSVREITAPSRERTHRAVVEAFLNAALTGDLDGLIAVLAPNAILRADAATQQLGSQPELVGAREVAGQFAGRSQAARLVWIDGTPEAAWVHRSAVKVAFSSFRSTTTALSRKSGSAPILIISRQRISRSNRRSYNEAPGIDVSRVLLNASSALTSESLPRRFPATGRDQPSPDRLRGDADARTLPASRRPVPRPWSAPG